MSVSEINVSTRGAPARSRQETRRRLLAAGVELFASEGLHGVTSTEIARKAGVATGTFYLHFRDKQVLFREIVFDALGQLRARLGQAVGPHVPGSISEVRARYDELLAFAEENRSLFRVLFGRGNEAADLGEDVLDSLLPGIEAGLRQRASRGDRPDLDAAVSAQALVGMVTRVLAWWVEDPRRAPRESVVATLTALHPGSLFPAKPDSMRPPIEPQEI